jgi:excisionase family DNA binding protein
MKSRFRPDEAAELLKLTKRTLYRFIKNQFFETENIRGLMMVNSDILIRAQTDELLTPIEIARMFRISKTIVYNLFNDGAIEGVKFYRTIRIWKSSLLKFLERED